MIPHRPAILVALVMIGAILLGSPLDDDQGAESKYATGLLPMADSDFQLLILMKISEDRGALHALEEALATFPNNDSDEYQAIAAIHDRYAMTYHIQLESGNKALEALASDEIYATDRFERVDYVGNDPGWI